MASSDLVATWSVALPDGNHEVQFEHGTTTGKRVIRTDGEEIYRKDWMFKLVGKEHFTIGKANCTISIDAVSGFAYEYTLQVNGKDLRKFSENQSKIMRTWVLHIAGHPIRVVLEKGTLDVWVNGSRVPTTGEFTDEGTETHFQFGDHSGIIRAFSSGSKRIGIVHQLFVDGTEIPLANE